MTNPRPLQLTEYALLAGSGAGAIAAIAVQNAFYASAPLTLLAAIGLLNRNRLETKLKQTELQLDKQTHRISKKLTYLGKQISALPSPEAMTTFQQATVSRTDRAFEHLSQNIQTLKRDVDYRFDTYQQSSLEPIHQDISQLQEQVKHFHTALDNTAKNVSRLSSLPRLETAENQLAQLTTEVMQLRVNLESITGESRAAISHLGDSIGHVERGLKQLPVMLDPRLIREEVQQLIRTVADLVPQRDFNNLASRLQELHHRQVELQRALDALRQSQSPSDPDKAVHLNHLPIPSQPLPHTAEISPDLIKSLSGPILSDLQQQISELNTVVQQLNHQQSQLHERLETIKAEPTPKDQDFHNQDSLNALHQTESLDLTWLVDFVDPAAEAGKTNSRKALAAALAQAQEQLLLTWPWSSDCHLDANLVSQFQALLARGCQLEIGWCYWDVVQQGRLLRTIEHRWNLASAHLKPLKAALRQLLPLRQAYPQQFRFKILGTDETFLVCDRTYAILGLQDISAQNTTFSSLGLKIQVTDSTVVNALTRRFIDPSLSPETIFAYFNRATTRFDLRDYLGAIDDYTEVLLQTPDHAVALNNRGVAYKEIGHSADAEADFTQALATRTNLFAAYCNRGWLRLDQERFPAAIQDFTYAIQSNPESPIPYVYRGSALQRLGDINSAISDYNRAIVCGQSHALPYIYRSAAYQRQGEIAKAIVDLEVAQQCLQANSDSQVRLVVERTLKRLRHAITLENAIQLNHLGS